MRWKCSGSEKLPCRGGRENVKKVSYKMVARDLDGGRGGESWARKAGEVVVRCFGFGWRAFECTQVLTADSETQLGTGRTRHRFTSLYN